MVRYSSNSKRGQMSQFDKIIKARQQLKVILQRMIFRVSEDIIEVIFDEKGNFTIYSKDSEIHIKKDDMIDISNWVLNLFIED